MCTTPQQCTKMFAYRVNRQMLLNIIKHSLRDDYK